MTSSARRLLLAGVVVLTAPAPAPVAAGPATTTTTLAVSTTTTSSTSTTTPAIPQPPACADVNEDARVTATDALGVLQAAVGSRLCGRCVCDVDGSGSVVASDALATLNFAVGQPIALTCPAGGATVEWTGGGDATSWEDGANWSMGAVPDPCEVVLIDAAAPALSAHGVADPVIAHATGEHGALAIFSTRELELTGGSLTVPGHISVANRFLIGSAMLSSARVVAALGGTVELTGAAALDAVTFDTSVDAPLQGTFVTVTNGLTVNATMHFNRNSGIRVNGAGEQAILGSGEIQLDSPGVGSILSPNEPETIVRIGPGLTVVGNNGQLGGSQGALVIEGTVTPMPGFSMLVTSPDWTNDGTITAAGGAMRITGSGINNGLITETEGGRMTIGGDWLNVGDIAVVDSTVDIGDSIASSWQSRGTIEVVNTTTNLNGSFVLADLGAYFRTGGQTQLRGVLENAVGLVLDDDRGDWILVDGGTIVDGTVVAMPGHELIVRTGTLDGVTLLSDVNATANGSSVTFLNGTLLNSRLRLQTNGQLRVDGGGVQALLGTGEVEFLNSGVPSTMVTDGATLNLSPAMQVIGAAGIVGSATANLNVNGRVETTAAGNTMTLQAAVGVNNGEIIAAMTGIRLLGAWANNFLLTVEPGRTLQATDDLALNLPGTLEVRIASTTSVGKLIVGGQLTLGGTLIITLADGYEPNLGDTFRVIDYTSVSGAFDVLLGLDIGNGKLLQTNYETDGLTLEVVAQ